MFRETKEARQGGEKERRKEGREDRERKEKKVGWSLRNDIKTHDLHTHMQPVHTY